MVEVGAVVGLALIVWNGLGALRELKSGSGRGTGRTHAVADGSHIRRRPAFRSHLADLTGRGAPNDEEIPANLRPLVQSLPAVGLPTPGPEQANSIFVPALWSSSAPVVQGDGWEQLKKGVGQYVGSPNPGEPGTIVLSAHNDIFGELFRDLDRLKTGDEIRLTTATREFVYRVTGHQPRGTDRRQRHGAFGTPDADSGFVLSVSGGRSTHCRLRRAGRRVNRPPPDDKESG